MSAFIDAVKSSKGIMTYELLRNAVFHLGLPFNDEYVDVMYEQYQETGELPDFLEDLIDQYGYYGD